MRLLTKAALLLLALDGAGFGATLSAVVSPRARLRPAGIDAIFIIRYSPFKYFKFHRKFELANIPVDRANGQIRLGFFWFLNAIGILQITLARFDFAKNQAR